MTDNSAPETEDSRLTAAEYVLGVLGAPERRAVEQRIARDQVFAREVAFWEKRRPRRLRPRSARSGARARETARGQWRGCAQWRRAK